MFGNGNLWMRNYHMLESVETAAAGIGQMANSKKPKVMSFKNPGQAEIKAKVHLFEVTYEQLQCRRKRRIALAWTACNKLCKIWRSSLSRTFKLRLFRATVETVLLHGSET